MPALAAGRGWARDLKQLENKIEGVARVGGTVYGKWRDLEQG